MVITLFSKDIDVFWFSQSVSKFDLEIEVSRIMELTTLFYIPSV